LQQTFTVGPFLKVARGREDDLVLAVARAGEDRPVYSCQILSVSFITATLLPAKSGRSQKITRFARKMGGDGGAGASEIPRQPLQIFGYAGSSYPIGILPRSYASRQAGRIRS
jgi:hypothetical protein